MSAITVGARRYRLRAACAALLTVLALAGAGQALHAAGAAPERNKLTGTWDRDPAGGAGLDPRYTSRTPAPDPPLKPEYKTEWLARAKPTSAGSRSTATTHTACRTACPR